MQTGDAKTKSSNPTKSTPRFVALVATVATMAFAASAAAPSVSAAHGMPVPGGCDEWGCGTNHNEVIATPNAV